MVGIFSQVFLGSCVLSISIIFLGITMLVRSSPALYDLSTRILRSLLDSSFHLYRYLLVFLNPYLQTIIHLNLLENPTRAIATILLSLLIGSLLCLLLHWQISLLILIILVLHGAFIGLAWKDFFEPVGLHMGERLQ